jgi:hypothetical protein
MVILAELKMHICDKHACKQTGKRLKQVFQIRTDAERAAAALAVPSQPLTQVASLQQPVYPEAMANSPEESEASDDDTNNTPQPGGSSGQCTPRSRLMNSFRSMVERQSQLVDDDDTDCTPVTPSAIGLTPIKFLFNFSHSHWVDMYSKSSIRSFDEELQLYEMLDLDAEGEDNVDVDVDDDTGDILMG